MINLGIEPKLFTYKDNGGEVEAVGEFDGERVHMV